MLLSDAVIAPITPDWTARTFWLNVAAFGVGTFTLVAAGIAAWYARRAANTAASALELENEPRLSVTIPGGASVRHGKWGRKGLFTSDGDAFTLHIANSGRGEANLLRVYRRWEYVKNATDLPLATYPPSEPGRFDELTDMIIGPAGISIASYSEQRRIPIKPEQMILYGWLEYRSRSTEKMYVTGFAYAYLPHVAGRGMVAGWFGSHGRDYWFHREIDQHAEKS